MFDFIVIELVIFGKHFFQQRPKARDVPLPVPEVVDEIAHRFLRRHLEGFIKTAAGQQDPQVCIQDHKGFTCRFDNVFKHRSISDLWYSGLPRALLSLS